MTSMVNSSVNNSTIPLSYYFLDGLNFFFNHIYLLLLAIIGSIGNAFVIIVFGQKAFQTRTGSIGSNLSVYPFLFYMAISDTMYLIILFCLWLSNYMNVLHRPVICQFTLYITYVCNFINAYYTIAFTAQRLFAVIHPFQVSRVLSWYRSRCLALSIIVFACFIYSYLPFLVGIVDGKCFSRPKYRWINKSMDIIDSIIVFLIPYIVIITMNTIILISLHRMKHDHQEFLFQNQSHVNRIRELTRRNASRKVTKLLLTVSTSYLIICAPYASIHTWRLLNNQQEENTHSQLINKLEHYSLFIYHISFAMNFYIYISFGTKFRRELKRIFTKAKQNFWQYFEEKEFFDNENQFELTDRNSSMSGEYSFNGNLNNNDDTRKFIKNYQKVLERGGENGGVNSNRFEGNGLSFKCKIIGMEEIPNECDEKTCLELMCKQKNMVRARGEHKQRILLTLTMNEIKLFDESIKISITDHEITRISTVILDPSDSRAFGYVYDTNDNRHQLWAIRTDRAALIIITALKELFEILEQSKTSEIPIEETDQATTSSEATAELKEQSSIPISTLQPPVIPAKPIAKPVQAPKMRSFNLIWGDRTLKMISQAASVLQTPAFDDPWGDRSSPAPSSSSSSSRSPSFNNTWGENPTTTNIQTTSASITPVFDDTWDNNALRLSTQAISKKETFVTDDPWRDTSSKSVPQATSTFNESGLDDPWGDHSSNTDIQVTLISKTPANNNTWGDNPSTQFPQSTSRFKETGIDDSWADSSSTNTFKTTASKATSSPAADPWGISSSTEAPQIYQISSQSSRSNVDSCTTHDPFASIKEPTIGIDEPCASMLISNSSSFEETKNTKQPTTTMSTDDSFSLFTANSVQSNQQISVFPQQKPNSFDSTSAPVDAAPKKVNPFDELNAFK